MGDGMLHRCAFAQCGSSALGSQLGPQLVLELLVFADTQAPALPHLRFGTLGAYRTRITGTGRKLGGPPWHQRHGLTLRTGHCPVHEVEGEVGFGKEITALRPGAGNNVHSLCGPLDNPWTAHVAEINV